jgi:hypothetical protein
VEEAKHAIYVDDASDSEASSTYSSSSEAEKDPLSNAVDELGTSVRCLQDLNKALDCPVLDPEHEIEEPAAPTIMPIVSPHQFYANCIRERFPHADASLVDSLGNANLERYQYLLQRKADLLDTSEEEEDEEVSAPIKDSATFHDSGYGTSQYLSSYAPSVGPSIASTFFGGSSKFPPLPDEGKRGEKFECDGCGKLVRITRTSEWR